MKPRAISDSLATAKLGKFSGGFKGKRKKNFEVHSYYLTVFLKIKALFVIFSLRVNRKSECLS